MGEVARAKNADAFAARPRGQMAGIEGLAGGTGKTGMDVQVVYGLAQESRSFFMK
ncbi:hypothetical protein Defa_27020 [Desulfovibrio sp. TH_2024_36128]|uniref:Uncharacterized protein n=1 Tax=Desulfovibrio falkowii TaxID=3136602 RepID=A0ABQ0EBM6_9BACT